MTILAESEYIHLHYKNASIKHFYSSKTIYKQSDNYKKMVNVLEKKFDLKNKIPEYFNSRYSNEFDSLIKDAMENSNINKPMSALELRKDIFEISSSIQGMKKSIRELDKLKNEVKKEIKKLSNTLESIDNYENILREEIIELSIINPAIRKIFNIEIPDGRYDISKSIFNNVDGQISRIERTIEGNTITALPRQINRCFSKAAGFLREAEILKGFLLASKLGNTSAIFVPTGTLNKDIKIDKKIQQDSNEIDKMVQEITEMLIGITSTTPKADIIGYSNGIFAGFSLKTTNEAKLKATTSFSRKKAIPLGVGSNPLTIFNENNKLFTSLLGTSPKVYAAQTLISLHEGEENKAAKDWRSIMDVVSTLSITDALVGSTRDFNKGGYATYLVVNATPFKSEEILQSIIKTLKNKQQSAVFYDTDNDIKAKEYILQGEERAKTMLLQYSPDEKEKRSNTAKREAVSYLKNIGNTKVSISLGALMHHGELKSF